MMNIHTDKTPQTGSHSFAAVLPRVQRSSVQSKQLSTVQQMINNSIQASQSKAVQQMIANSRQTQKPVQLKAATNGHAALQLPVQKTREQEDLPAGIQTGMESLSAYSTAAGKEPGNLQKQSLPQGNGAYSHSKPVQRYSIAKNPEGGKLGKDKEMIVHNKKLYAPADKVEKTNNLLAQAGPFGALIRLKSTGGELKTDDAKGISFLRAEPVVDEKSKELRLKASPNSHHQEMVNPKDGPLQIWADCGRASEVVTGSSPGTMGSDRKVKFGGQFGSVNQSGGYSGKLDREAQNDSKTGRLSMAVYTESIFPFIDEYGIDGFSEKLLKQFFPDLAKLKGEELEEAKYEKLRLARDSSIATAEKLYSSLTPEAKEAFHKFTGTNEYANPDVGDAYSTITEYGMPGFKESGDDWAFHWGGVVMKDTADNVTLENLSVSNISKKNNNWYFAMYGTENKEQTFHFSEMRGSHHGSIGTTINVTTSKALPEESEKYMQHFKEMNASKHKAKLIYEENDEIITVKKLYSYFDHLFENYQKYFNDTGKSSSYYPDTAEGLVKDMHTAIREYLDEN